MGEAQPGLFDEVEDIDRIEQHRELLRSCWREGFAVRLVHFRERGYRYWAFQRHTGYDQEVGLSPDGYATEPEAWAAIERLATPTDRSESDE